MKKRERIIVALDTQDFSQCRKWVRALKGQISFFKVGSELYTAVGRKAVDFIHDQGGRVFLDLKFHDIPNTVAQAAMAAAKMGVKMFNVHTLGGSRMMREAKQAARGLGQKPWVLGVTVLTSHAEREIRTELRIQHSIQSTVLHLAKLAQKSGLDGIVASAKEVSWVKQKLGKSFMVVTPGIRPAWAAQNDQVRVVTPAEAFALGSDFIVIGRPVTAAKDIRAAAERIVEEVEKGHKI